jgi:hypothetical protein
MAWIPTPFNLLDGNPFEYSEHAISSISSTEAFQTGIEKRDIERCVVCGQSEPVLLNHAHIIPKIEKNTVRYTLLF